MRYILEDSKRVSGATTSAMSRDRNGKKWEDYETIKLPSGKILNMVALVNEQAKAKAALIHLEPIFSTFANKLEVVYTFHIKTQATDGYHLFVNPEFTDQLTFEEKVFVMAHECMHCVLDHMRRGQQAGHDPKRSNIAADYEVNDTLVEMGLFQASTIRKIKALYDKKYIDWSYERIYDDNPSGASDDNNNSGQSQDAEKNSNSDEKSGGSDSENDNGGNPSSGDPSGDGQESQDKKKKDSGRQSSQKDSGRGGGSQGHVRPEDCEGQYGSKMPSTPGGFMSANEGNKLAEAEGYDSGPTDDANANGWKEASINQAMKDNRTDAHGGMAKLYAKILGLWRTSTNWKKSFRKIIGRALNTQDKRQAYANKNVLATRNMVARTDKDKFDAVDYMTIFIDSSGSVSDDMLKYMLSEVYNIACQFKPETLVVIQLDTKVQECQIFHSLKEFNRYAKIATVKGRGGNRQQACWDFLRNDKRFKGSSSELVIMFTDGWLDQHKRDPKTMNNLCWAILDNPSFQLQYPEPRTSVVHLDSSKIK